jgi:hypothetical protein
MELRHEVKQHKLQDFFLAFEIILILYIHEKRKEKKDEAQEEDAKKFQAI